jgi:hypothetical protein
MNRSKARGTAAETAVVRAARPRGFPWADRSALHGRLDIGDVNLCPGVILEIKGGDMARRATDLDIERWLNETEIERANAGAEVGLLVVQRPHVGAINAHRWHVHARLGWIAELGPHMPLAVESHQIPVRLTLADALLMLRAAGWGTPLDDGDE